MKLVIDDINDSALTPLDCEDLGNVPGAPQYKVNFLIAILSLGDGNISYGPCVRDMWA